MSAPLRYQRVCLEGFGYTLPDEIVSTAQIEQRLAPLYERLRLPEGRLELMTGIRERRFFPAGTRPGSVSIETGRRAVAASGIDSEHFGALIHGSVCRDYLEPATASRVHHGVGLPPHCQVYDVSNACLGLINGMVQVANMIELGQIRAGLIVGTECGRTLVENTIELLNRDTSLDRSAIKPLFASLTIGAASVGIVLCDRELSRTGNRFTTAVAHCDTSGHELCAGQGMDQMMLTNSESLLRQGVKTARATFDQFLAATGWERDDIQRTFCHQVGSAYRRELFDALELNTQLDYTTLEWLGNTASSALPLTMALGVETGAVREGDHVAVLGVGSGINCLMLAVEWQKSLLPESHGSEALLRQGVATAL